MMTSACAQMRVLLSGLLDHELDAASERAILEHLGNCEGCRAERHELESLSGGLREAGQSVPMPPPWERIASSLASRSRPRGAWRLASPGWAWPLARPGAWPHARSKWTSLLWLLASAAVLGLLGVVGGAVFHATRKAVPAEVVLAGLSPEFISQLVDPDRQPDFSLLGTARAVDRRQLHEVPRHVSFTPHIPETLPGGYSFESGWVITSKLCRTICLRYRRGDQVLGVLQGASSGTQICSLSNPQCCLMGGLTCRRSRIERVDVVQTTREGLALTVAVTAGEADIEALMASLAGGSTLRN